MVDYYQSAGALFATALVRQAEAIYSICWTAAAWTIGGLYVGWLALSLLVRPPPRIPGIDLLWRAVRAALLVEPPRVMPRDLDIKYLQIS